MCGSRKGMEIGIIILTLGAYGLAIYLWWQEHSPNYMVALVAGHLSALLSPLWQVLYGFNYSETYPALYTIFGHPLPRPIFIAAWTIMLPPLIIFYLYHHRWWFASYITSVLTFVLFVLYYVLIETVATNAGWWRYSGQTALPLGIPPTLLAGLMNGLIGIGLLWALLATRRYSWSS